MNTVMDALADATKCLQEATDRVDVAHRSLEHISPKLANEARSLGLQAEDVLMRVTHAAEALQGSGL